MQYQFPRIYRVIFNIPCHLKEKIPITYILWMLGGYYHSCEKGICHRCMGGICMAVQKRGTEGNYQLDVVQMLIHLGEDINPVR